MTDLAYVPSGWDGRYRKCREGCGTWDFWRNMHSLRRTEYSEGAEQREGTSQEIDDVHTGRQRTWWEHTCETCWAKKTHQTLEQARRDIKAPLNAKGIKHCQEFREGRDLLTAEWKMLGCFVASEEDQAKMSKTQLKKAKRRKLTAILKMNHLEDVFKQWLPLLAAKAVDMELAYDCAQKLSEWHNNVPTSKEELAGDKNKGARAARSRAGLFLCVCACGWVCVCVSMCVCVCICGSA